ncbi:MAG: large conductance mechanosensitive channel protein MscL [Ktedonobacteraceae bacterium]|nr:large conductance mechanosensitive channel protein MscL [Ktedonobacteraceae bacterium]
MNTLRQYGERGWRSGLETLGGFRKFILRGNVVDLAVGIVIGAAFTGVVNALVADFITPLIGWILSQGGTNLQDLAHRSSGAFKWGDFINALITFLLTAAALYFFVVLPVSKFQDRFLPKSSDAPAKRECPFCLSEVPLKATRCAFCTSQLPPVEETPTTTAK